ncbi:MAG: transporter substrate-binding domain-containing protein [Desulfovibrionaceae bacterium]|jgi:polar amino acid transport system substrate-binding protein|nr:transporter substrate-binding domain-containing protein [Desulfovibrionaceae bacterium]
MHGRAFAALCAVLALVWVAAGVPWGVSPAAAGDAQAKAVTVACDAHFAPYTMLDQAGRPEGLLVDFWKLWGEHAGVEVRFAFSDWAGSIQAVRDGSADVHSGLFANPQRAAWFAFSRPFYRSTMALFSPASAPVQTVQDIGEGMAGAIVGSDGAASLRAAGVAVRVYATPGGLVNGALAGEIAAFADERLGMLDYLAQAGLRDQFVMAGQPLYAKEFVAAVRKDRRDVLALVNEGLALVPEREVRALERSRLDR